MDKFIDQLTRLLLDRPASGYSFVSAMELAQQHGISEEDAVTAMRESRRFCTGIETRQLFLSGRGGSK